MDNARPYSKRKTNTVNLYEAIPLQKPLSANVELSGICNFKCSFCPQGSNDFFELGRAKTMPVETYDKIWTEMHGWEGSRLKALTLHGFGEPLTHPDFCSIINMHSFTEISEYTTLVTNGSLLRGDKAEAILESDIDYIKISIYSVIQDRHERITKSSTDIDDIYRNISAFRTMRDKKPGGMGPFIYIKMLNTFSDENDLFFERYSALADEIALEEPINWNGDQDYIMKAYGGEHELYNKACESGKSESNRYKEVCIHPFYMLFILNDGRVPICCIDGNPMDVYGNIHLNSIKEIWCGVNFDKIRCDFLSHKQHTYHSCKKCNHFKSNRISSNITIDNVTLEEYQQRKERQINAENINNTVKL